jgi:peptidyl-tRNA hydrolase, PTH1 family
LKLIVGLGNPGLEYHLTRHNLGFMAVDRLAEQCGVEIARPEAQALTGHARIGATEAVLAKPMTFMNLSGLAVRKLMDRYEAAPEDLIVLVDDADLPFGSLRIRQRGSAGGHNGLKSVIGAIGSDEFVRVRMGIKPDEEQADGLVSHVLGRFRRRDLEGVAEMVDRAAEAVTVVVREGAERAMSLFNRRTEPNGEAR